MQISLVSSTIFGWSGRTLSQLRGPQGAVTGSPSTHGHCARSSTSLQHRAEAPA